MFYIQIKKAIYVYLQVVLFFGRTCNPAFSSGVSRPTPKTGKYIVLSMGRVAIFKVYK